MSLGKLVSVCSGEGHVAEFIRFGVTLVSMSIFGSHPISWSLLFMIRFHVSFSDAQDIDVPRGGERNVGSQMIG